MRSALLGVFSVVLAPAIAVAQVQNPYAQGTAQPAPPPPPQQPYPYYPPPQQPYPSYPPPQQQVQRPAPPPPAAAPARLTLATRSMEVAQLVTACANAIDNY